DLRARLGVRHDVDLHTVLPFCSGGLSGPGLSGPGPSAVPARSQLVPSIAAHDPVPAGATRSGHTAPPSGGSGARARTRGRRRTCCAAASVLSAGDPLRRVLPTGSLLLAGVRGVLEGRARGLG